MTSINVGLYLSYVTLFHSSLKINCTYVQFDGIVYQHIVRISVGTNSVFHLKRIYIYIFMGDFISNL